MTLRRCFLLGFLTMVALSPAHGQTSAREAAVAIDGYDTVAYFTMGKPTKGDPANSFVWNGERYLFASEEHRRLFTADPDKYAPQFSGYCAASLGKGVKVEARPEQWTIVDGRLFLFAGPAGIDMIKRDPALIARADEHWARQR
jgi:hypothetical protein